MSKVKCSCGKEAWVNICKCGKVLKTYEEKCISCNDDCDEKNLNYKCHDCAGKEVARVRKKLIEYLSEERVKQLKDLVKKDGMRKPMIILD